jgi:hypothetical protein
MARLTNDVPYKIPILGLVRLDMFYGKLQGHGHDTPLSQPWIHGENLQPSRAWRLASHAPMSSLERSAGSPLAVF